MNRLTENIIRCRWPIIIGFLAVTALFAMQIPKSEIDPDMKSNLPETIPSRIDTEKIDDLFGGTEMIMVLIKSDDVLSEGTLRRVRTLSKRMKRIRGVDKVLSLFDLKYIRNDQGAMIVDPAVRFIPKNETERQQIRDEIIDNDMVYGSVVSEDFTLTAVIGILKLNVSDTYMVGQIQKLIKDVPGEEETIIGGLPYLRGLVGKNIRADMIRLMPLGILIMLVFLFACFRQLRGVLLPFFVVLMSIFFGMGIVPLIGWKIQILTIILPVFLIAVANDYGIHMIARYQEENIPGAELSKEEMARRMFSHLSRPILLTGLTTMAGMLCLLGHTMIGARQLGVLSALGIVYALAASLFFIPAVVSLLPRARPILNSPGTPNGKSYFLERLLAFFGRIVSVKPRQIIVFFLGLTVLAAIGILFIVVDTDPNSYYSEDHPVPYATRLIDENLGGSQNISVVFEGDIKDPALMAKIDSLEHVFRAFPEIEQTTSIARVIRQMSRALNDPGDSLYDQVPKTRNAIAQYFELYAMSGDAEDFEKLVDFPYEHAIISTRINTTSTKQLSRIVKRVDTMLSGDPDVLLVGGFGVVLSDLARIVVNGQFLSLGLALITVSLLLMLLFRSVTAGLISAIPLGISMIILFGLMGVFSIELNVATAMLSSIMIGVGVDYTIHFLWRYKEERKSGLSPEESVQKTLTTTGRGIVFNALSVIIGFLVLLVSTFLPVRFFGFLVIVSIFACLIGALIVVPSLCIVLRPKFLEPAAVGTADTTVKKKVRE